MATTQCPHCGEELPTVVDAFCPFCRESLDESAIEPETLPEIVLEPRKLRGAQLKIAIAIIVELFGVIWGTVTICNPAHVGILVGLAWLVSLISTCGLLAAGLQINKSPGSLVFRALVVSAFVFIVVIASAIFAAMVHMR